MLLQSCTSSLHTDAENQRIICLWFKNFTGHRRTFELICLQAHRKGGAPGDVKTVLNSGSSPVGAWKVGLLPDVAAPGCALGSVPVPASGRSLVWTKLKLV